MSIRGISGTKPGPCLRSCGELEFLSPALIWVAQSRHCVYVCGNKCDYSLGAFVIIFFCDLFCVNIFMWVNVYGKCIFSVERYSSRNRYFCATLYFCAGLTKVKAT